MAQCWYQVEDDSTWLSGEADPAELEPAADSPGEHPFAAFAEPAAPDCARVPLADDEVNSSGLHSRLVPVVFTPSDHDGGGGTNGVTREAVAELEESVIASLERVQAWYRSALTRADLPGRSFNVDRPVRVAARLPTRAYWCSGRAQCSSSELPHRVIDELADRGLPLFSSDKLFVVIVRGGGRVATSYRRSDGGGTVAVLGDLLVDDLLSGCDASAGCQLDRALAHIIGHLVGLPEGEGASSVMAPGPAGLDAPVPLEALTLDMVDASIVDQSQFMGAGTLAGGEISLSSDQGTVYDLSFGKHSALVVWGANQGPERIFGIHYQNLRARLVRVDGSLGPEIDVATTPPINDFSLGDREASIAYDANSDAFQVVFHRLWSDGGSDIRHGIRTRRLSAETGQPLAPDIDLGLADSAQPVETDIAYSQQSDSFVVVWASTSTNIGATGSTLYAVELRNNGTVAGSPVALGEDAKYPSVVYDPSRSRYLVTWTRKGAHNWDNSIVGRFVRTDGAPVSPEFFIRPTNREAMLSEAAYDPVTDQYLVSFWEHGDVYDWDILTQAISAGSGARIGSAAVLASGPAEFQYDPAIAYSPSRGRFLVSYGDDPGPFFDGLGHVRAQWVDSAGQSDGFSLWIRPHYDADARTEVAAHATDDLAGVAWSGQQGISVDVFQTAERRDRPPLAGTVTSRVMVIVVDPILTSSNRRLRHHMGWNDYAKMTMEIMDTLSTASGGYVEYQIMDWRLVDDIPVLRDGFRYDEQSLLDVIDKRTEEHKPNTVDYAALLNRFDICDLVAEENLSEVWVWGYPGLGTDEYAMKIPGNQLPYPPVSGSWYRPFNIPDCGKTLWVMGWNYEREVASALHSYAHRVEGILSLTVGKGRWYENEDIEPNNPWRLFSLYETLWPGQAAVGSVHEPPNSTRGYEYDNQRFVQSTADDWLAYPSRSGVSSAINCEAWDCSELGYMKWYLRHLPRAPGQSDGFHNNWWRYVIDYDNRL